MSPSDTAGSGRRDFIKAVTLMAGSLIGVVLGLPSLAYLLAPSMRKAASTGVIDAGPLEDFPVGIPRLFEFTLTQVNGWERTAMNSGVFVVRQADGSVRAFSNVCTHLGCRVRWHADLQHYVSPCHDGHFDILGNNLSGPPPRPLDEYETEVRDDRLFLKLPPYRRTA